MVSFKSILRTVAIVALGARSMASAIKPVSVNELMAREAEIQALSKPLIPRTIPVICAVGQASVPSSDVYNILNSTVYNILDRTLLHKTNGVPDPKPIPAGKMLSQNLIVDWDNHLMLSFFVNNTCTSDFMPNNDTLAIKYTAIADQCSNAGTFSNGTTWYGCLRFSIWTYLT